MIELIIIGYLLGSIPFGFLIAKMKGVDIRTVGSGNIGGTNVARKFGFRYGLLVGLLDVAKSFIPSYLAFHYLTDPWQISIVLLTPIIGHIFPIWLKFKGGKGVACLIGVLASFLPWYQLLVIMIVWLILLKITKIMSLVNIILVILLPFLMWYTFLHEAYVVYGIIMILIVWFAHRSNIKRLIKGQELKLRI